MATEAAYQAGLIKRIQRILPGCYILKNDPSENQGIPDILILFGGTWAMLEVKRSSRDPYRPNQEYFINVFNGMSFAAVIFPENEEFILEELASFLS